jgi:hypothetical protein
MPGPQRQFSQVGFIMGRGSEASGASPALSGIDILRRWDLRRWGGKMRPACFDGKMLLSSWPVCARPRLSALTPLAPEPHHGGGERAKALWVIPAADLNRCHPCLITTYFLASKRSVDKFTGKW